MSKAKPKGERIVCVWFDQVSDFDDGAWIVADEWHLPNDGGCEQTNTVTVFKPNARDAAVAFGTERAKLLGVPLAIHGG
jgi:hypothetical protein